MSLFDAPRAADLEFTSIWKLRQSSFLKKKKKKWKMAFKVEQQRGNQLDKLNQKQFVEK